MRFLDYNTEYEVVELHNVGDGEYMGLMAIFEIQYCHYEDGKGIQHTEEEFLDQDDHLNSPIIMEEMVFNMMFLFDKTKNSSVGDCYIRILHECHRLLKEKRRA